MCPGWRPAAEDTSLYNFKWKPVSNGINYDLVSKHGMKQIVNHVQGHCCLSTKDNIFLNMKSYYETLKHENIYDVVPLTFVLDYQKDSISEQVTLFLNVNKMFDKVI